MDVDDFLEHHGVKGQKWGVRNKETRTANNEARIKRLKSGKGSLKDKLIRDLDIGGTRTAVNPSTKRSTGQRVTLGVVGVALMAKGAIEINRILKISGHKHL